MIRSRAVARLLIVALVFASLLAVPAFTSTASASRGPNVADPAAGITAQAPQNCPPTLERGDRGSWVKTLQDELNDEHYDAVGPTLIVDGVFGKKTLRAVKNFQEFFELEVDGIVGPQTWYMLGWCDQID